MGELRADEECDEAGCCLGVLSFNQARVIYRTERGTPVALATPNTLSPMLTRRSDFGDPSICNVALHTVACRRVITAGGVQVPESLNTPAAPPPIARSLAAASYDACDAFTVGRVGGPQFRVRFRDGSEDYVTVYVDGSSTLAWPCDTVDIDLLTPALAFELNTGLLGKGLPATFPAPTTPTPEGYVDAFAYASVSWSSRNAVASAPGGMATFTQAQNTSGVPPAGGPPDPMYFDRPPFSRRVQLVLDSGALITVGALVEFMDGPTVIGPAAMGLYLGGILQQQGGSDVPHECTHLRVTALAGVPDGERITAIWEIGVR